MEALRAFLESEGHQVFVFAPHYPGYKDEADFVRRFPSVTLPAKVRFPLALPIAPGSLREIAVHEAFHPGALVAAAAMLAVGAIVCASIA